MGKDREGKFHPKKGKPSAAGKIEGRTGLKDINTNAIEDYLEIADKYTVGEEAPAPNIHVRHPNRNVDKGEDRRLEKADNNNRQNPSYKSKAETLNRSAVESKPIREITGVLTKDILNELAAVHADHCISFYMETHQAGVEKNEQKDTIAFKNLLQQITYQLRQKTVDQSVIDSLLKPGYDLLRDNEFWLAQHKGLAVFISDTEFRYMKLPFTPKEEILINTSYYVSPLLPLFMNRDYFYVLVFSKKQAKLYRADQFGIVHIPIAEMPNGIDDVVHFEEKDDQKLFRTDTSGAGQGANFHGIGSGKPDEKANIAMYFDEVDETLWKAVLSTENVPLLLAGVDYMIPIYKGVAKYKYIWNDALTGSYEHEDMNSLYQEAIQKMTPYFRERHEKAKALYGNQSATALTSSIPADVIPAAYYSRVWHLFVTRNEHIWGTFDELNNKLAIHDIQEDGDEDLIDKAIMRTILNGGEVHMLDQLDMPVVDARICAVMRYEA
ncbi:MAG TPA: hypothetical protein VD927_17500 [Chryseosolibacter sp.]|nr:hypothetical protein [Chryseosolibacter sp.]